MILAFVTTVVQLHNMQLYCFELFVHVSADECTGKEKQCNLDLSLFGVNQPCYR